MNAAELTDPQRRALAVLVAAETHEHFGRRERRPVRTSNHTTPECQLGSLEMLTVQTRVARSLIASDLVLFKNEIVGLLELTDAGRAVAREAGL